MDGPSDGPSRAPSAATGAGGAMRRLILLRHGKSDYPDDVPDHDRPLAPRGRREASLAGAWLAGTQPPIDAVLCSDALRTRQTLQCTGIDVAVRHDPRIYGASAGQIIEVLHELAPALRTVLVVGHAPGMPHAAAVLAGARSDPRSLAALHAGFPTSAVAVLDVPGTWAGLQPGACLLRSVHVPRG